MSGPRSYTWIGHGGGNEHDVYCSDACAQEALSGEDATGSRDATADEVRVAGKGYAWCRQPLVEWCECGAIGIHPVPIGGGWSVACDDCKAASLVAPQGDDDRPLTEADWEQWRRDAPGEEVAQ